MVFEYPMELLFGAQCPGGSKTSGNNVMGASIVGFRIDIY